MSHFNRIQGSARIGIFTPVAAAARLSVGDSFKAGQLFEWLEAPESEANAPYVLRILAASLNRYIEFCVQNFSYVPASVSQNKALMERLVNAWPQQSHLAPLCHIGVKCRARTTLWNLSLNLNLNTAPDSVLRLVGGEINYCLRTAKPFRMVIKDCLKRYVRLAGRHAVLPPEFQAALQDRLYRELRATYPAGENGHLFLNDDMLTSRLVAELNREIGFANAETRTAAPGHSMQREAEYLESATALRQSAEQHDPVATVISLAALIGLPLHHSLLVPLFPHLPANWVLGIDPAHGTIKTELSKILHQAKSTSPGSIPTSTTLVRPLPQFLANALATLVAKNPAAKRLQDMLDPVELTNLNRHLTNSANPDARIKASVAKFIAGTGQQALAAGLNHADAAYITGRLGLVGHARHHYLHFDRAEIWASAKRFFHFIGWGEAVPLEQGLPVGSQVVPTWECVQERDHMLVTLLHACRMGKKYTLAGLERHHERYALVCAARAAFITGARALHDYRFSSADFLPGSAIIQHPDKRVGILKGLAPLPIPALLQEQVRLWHAHLRCLDKRLHRLRLPPAHPVRRHLQAVLRHQDVPLFFTFAGESVHVPGSGDVEKALPTALHLKGDAGRHFWQNALRHQNVPSADIDLFMRHETVGLENFASTSTGCLQDAFARIRQAQERVLLQLGWQPVAGLAKE